MSGTLAIWYLLAHSAPLLTALGGATPITRIKEGELPIGVTLPAIQITRVSGTPRNTLAMTEPGALNSERVQVTVFTKATDATPAGPGKKGCDALLALVRAACPNQRGTIAGVAVDSILPDIVGPDLSDIPTGLYSGSIDFIVNWHNA